MEITFISDTHTKHKAFNTLLAQGGEVIVCCGDVTERGDEDELKKFIDWFDALYFRHKILVAGNHDFIFEQSPVLVRKLLKEKSITYLENSEVVIEGIKFYGSPVTPFLVNWAFTKQRGEEIKRVWEKIPQDTHVLITHGPPFGILDDISKGVHVGCPDLLKAVKAIQPKVHSFGHIHEKYGMVKRDGVCYINASLLNERYKPVNRPINITL